MKRIITPYLGVSQGYHCFACAPGNEHGLHVDLASI